MTRQGSKVFSKTCQNYYEEVCRVDFLARAEILGAQVEKGALVIPLYDQDFLFSSDGIRALSGEEILPAVQVMICKYILTCSFDTLPVLNNDLVTYREFKDSGPLTSYFTTNTNKTLESAFAGDVDGLRNRARQLGGTIVDSAIYDLSVKFWAFPRIPVLLNFNDKDEYFPAVCSVLYHASASFFLDMECLAMTGTLLTGKLLSTR